MRLRAGRRRAVTLCAAALLLSGAVHVVVTHESRAGSAPPPVTAIDGDTVQLDGKVIRLYGIDAPALGQHCLHDEVWVACGLAASHELNKQLRLARQQVKCVPAPAEATSDQVCFADDIDVAQALLTAGYVTASAAASPNYRQLEDKAREAKLGLWHSEFVAPAEWRQGKRLPNEPGPETDPCPIKAVVSPDGHHFYYVPTDDNYEAVKVDPAHGDRRYCSVESAWRDGWRRVGQIAGP